jgi:hypothetical protein
MGIGGLGLVVLAVFANHLGIGHKSGWGPGRIIVAWTGILLLAIAFLIITWGFWAQLLTQIRAASKSFLIRVGKHPSLQRLGRLFLSWKASWDRLPFVRWVDAHVKPAILSILGKFKSSRLARSISQSKGRQAGLAAAILGAGILVVYVWYVSVGHWTAWPKTTQDYDLLAQAFQHGQVALLVTPPPALLRLANPYIFSNRKGISIPWDVTLFHGKYYIYWGPMPAAVLVVFHLFDKQIIGDDILVFVFVSGTFVFGVLSLLRLRSRFFPDLGWGYLLPGILMAGLANPLPWLLNRPAVYEAAIAGGQFFLLVGFYCMLGAVGGQRFTIWKGSLASGLWLFAFASRLTLAPVLGFLLLTTAWWAWRVVGSNTRKIIALAALFLPFLLGLACLGWYNQIRFGSWLETGNRYQLTGNTVQLTGSIFSLANFAYDLQNYLINPYRYLSIFPFVKPNWGGISIFFPVVGSINSNSEQVSGLIPTTPYVLLAVIPVLFLFAWAAGHLVRSFHKTLSMPFGQQNGLFTWIAFTLIGAVVFASGPILLYMTSSMRYLADVIPLLVLLSTFGFWQGVQSLIKYPGFRRLFVTLAVLLAVFSVAISLLLAVTGYEARFEHLNPVLFDQLTRFFFW